MTPRGSALTLVACLNAVLVTVGCQNPAARSNLAPHRDGVFIHLTRG